MKVLDLFSGIGGFSLGLESAGFETIAFCEAEPFCQKVLKKHWPEVPIHADIRELDATQYRNTVGLVCGGYPCQPFSFAGKRNGQDDDRHLWPEMFRVIQECRPAWVLCENVAGHINMGLDSVLSDLEGEGYACQPLVIPACAIDAPHRRDRVWIIANNESGANGQHNTSKNKRQKFEFRKSACKTILADSDSDSGERLKHGKPDAQGWQKQGNGSPGSCGDGFRRWAAEPSVGRVANGVSDRAHRIKALGNAVVPQVVEVIGRAIMAADNVR